MGAPIAVRASKRVRQLAARFADSQEAEKVDGAPEDVREDADPVHRPLLLNRACVRRRARRGGGVVASGRTAESRRS